MQDTAIVALAIGSATILGGVMAAVSATVSEWRRARNSSRQAALARRAAHQEVLRQELRSALADARRAVIELSVTVQIALDIRSDPNARLDGDDLSHQVRKARADYPNALDALEALRTACRRPESKDAVDDLRATVEWAYSLGHSAGGESVEPERIAQEIRKQLRVMDGVMVMEEQLIAHAT